MVGVSETLGIWWFKLFVKLILTVNSTLDEGMSDLCYACNHENGFRAQD